MFLHFHFVTFSDKTGNANHEECIKDGSAHKMLIYSPILNL